MSALTALEVLGTEIRVNEEGLFSLTDLWKASGGEARNQPRRWAQLKRTKNVISELERLPDNDRNTVIKSDKKAGTFVDRVLVYSYAMHVSAKFEIEVIEAIDKHARKIVRKAGLHGKAE